jgi:hypothetical protein
MRLINALAEMKIKIFGKQLRLRHSSEPPGIRGRNFDNTLIKERLGSALIAALEAGMAATYEWVAHQVANR